MPYLPEWPRLVAPVASFFVTFPELTTRPFATVQLVCVVSPFDGVLADVEEYRVSPGRSGADAPATGDRPAAAALGADAAGRPGEAIEGEPADGVGVWRVGDPLAGVLALDEAIRLELEEDTPPGPRPLEDDEPIIGPDRNEPPENPLEKEPAPP
jgi:hypothetical protein